MKKNKEEVGKEVSEEEEYSGEEVEDGNSEEEWVPDAGENVSKKRPQRNAKKRHHSEEDEEEEEEEDDEEVDDEEEEEEDEESESDSGRKAKRQRRARKEYEDEDDEEDSDENNLSSSSEIPDKDFTSGSFVIAKSDLEGESDPILWRIDGKALLQKYLPFKEDDKLLYRSTSTYSGWSSCNKEKFLPAHVTFKSQTKNENIVELDLEKSELISQESVGE